MEKYDLIVIGSGPAGEKAAVKAAYFKYKVALIERSKVFGGTAVKEAVPAKVLKEIALYLSGKVQKDLYGLTGHKEEFPIELFMKRAQTLSLDQSQEVVENLQNHKVDIYRGEASFIDNHQVYVDDGKEGYVLYGDHIIIATGTSQESSQFPIDGLKIHDTKSIVNIEASPKSLCILGMGISGCEYGSIFSMMGTKVTFINRSSDVLPYFDRDTVKYFVGTLQAEGVKMIFNDEVVDIGKEGAMLKIYLKSGNTFEVDMVLYAFGRKGNIQTLKLENAGIDIVKGSISVDENFRTNVPNIYAVGDVTGKVMLANIGMDQGRVAVSHMFKIGDITALNENIPYGMYTSPEIAGVGITEQLAKEQGLEYGHGIAYYSETPRGKFLGTEGLVKLIFTLEDKIIRGVHITGPIATELVHYGVYLVRDQRTLSFLIGEPFNYPTLHEAYKYAAYDALGAIAGYKLKVVHPRIP